jgi:hypothetical protein
LPICRVWFHAIRPTLFMRKKKLKYAVNIMDIPLLHNFVYVLSVSVG